MKRQMVSGAIIISYCAYAPYRKERLSAAARVRPAAMLGRHGSLS